MSGDATVQHYNLFVIGGGSGGMSAAKRAADYGQTVAVADFVDPSPAGSTWGIGGTCLNVGCIPKKLFHTAAKYREEQVLAAGLGWDTKSTHNWETMMSNVNKYIKKQNFGHKSDLRSKKVEYFNNIAIFGEKTGAKHRIELYDARPDKGGVLKQTVEADQVIVCTGGRPWDGDYEGGDLCLSSDDIFWRKTPPGKTLVVGASYIALECAGFLNGLGFDTSVMVRSILLRGFDQEIADRIGDHMADDGVNFIRKTVPHKFYEKNGQIAVQVKNDAGEVVEFGEYDTVLLAIGRTGCASWLKPERAGLALNKAKDKFIVDDNDATNVPGIYAIGDVAHTRPELTPVAIQSADMLVDRLYGGKSELMAYDLVCTTVFTPLEYATVGVNEDEAKKLNNPDIKTAYTLFTPLEWKPASLEDSGLENRCLVKVVFDSSTDKILGLHFLGPNAGEVMQGFGVAMHMGLTKNRLDMTVGIHPTSAEEMCRTSKIKAGDGALEAKEGC